MIFFFFDVTHTFLKGEEAKMGKEWTFVIPASSLTAQKHSLLSERKVHYMGALTAETPTNIKK